MQVVVTGAGGLLGSNVVSEALDRGWEPTGTYHSEEPALNASSSRLDVREIDRFEALVDRTTPDAVINCAAMTDVDGCERTPEQAWVTNADAPGRLARACDARDIAFVHVSTDYVFDGRAETPYDETATPNPRQVYGESKLAGERAVVDAHRAPLLARLSFVYGIHRSTGSLAGFPSWLRDRLCDREPTSLFTDQHVTPSRAGQVATTLLDLLATGTTGTVHVASRSCVTPYEFGDEIRGRMELPEELLKAGRQANVDRPAVRPQYTCLDVDRVEAELGREQPTLAEDLDAIGSALS